MFNAHKGKGSGGYQGGKKFGEKKPWERDFGGRDSRPSMHKATCSDCGNACEVPFKPNGSRPIFCSNCFKKDGHDEPRKFGTSDTRKASFERPAYRSDYAVGDGKTAELMKEQFKIVNSKLDRILKALAESSYEEVLNDEGEIDKMDVPNKVKEKMVKKVKKAE